MSENTAQFVPPRPRATLAPGVLWRWVMAALLSGAVLACLWVMEQRFAGLEVTEFSVGETPVSYYRAAGSEPLPPVVVAHGFGGSRQMMDQISVSLARSGFAVAAFDFPGHGRNPALLSRDITRIEGTTAQLVANTLDVVAAVEARADTTGPVALVGHSMATDVVIRAAEQLPANGGVVAISMYSPAVTETAPERLLVLSGAFEGHLRSAALDALRLVNPDAVEGATVTNGTLERRAMVAPYVGHVGVLYAPTSLDEITRWLAGPEVRARLDTTGWVSALLLLALTILALPLSKALPSAPQSREIISARRFWLAMALPVPAAIGASLLPVFGVGGVAAFGSLALILGLFGAVQLWVLRRHLGALERPDVLGLGVYLVWGLAIFALALDHYGAAFLPSGPRLTVMAGLLAGTVPLMLADTVLVHQASAWRRVMARIALVFTLGTAMAMAPTELGLTFTVIPVMLLFFAVYGSLARWIGARRGAGGVALGKAIALAWALAASTPLFAG